MQDATINSALLHLRVQLVREDRNGLEHVEALLRLRRVPMPEVKRARRRAFDRRELRRALVALLRDRPMTCREMADHIQEAHGLTRRRARGMADSALARMRRVGWISLTDGQWSLQSIDNPAEQGSNIVVTSGVRLKQT